MKIVKEDVNNINDKATPVYDANLVLDAEIANDRADAVKNIVDPYEREKAKPFIGAEKQPLPKEEEPKITKEKEAKPFEESLNEATNTNEIVDLLTQFCDEYNEENYHDDEDPNACKVTTDYSGRFMYGKTCPGVVGPKDAQTDLIIFLAEHGLKDLVKHEMATDSMGLNKIFYFPHITLNESLIEDVELKEDACLDDLRSEVFNALACICDRAYIDCDVCISKEEMQDAINSFIRDFYDKAYNEEEFDESLTEGELDRNATKAEKDFWDQLNELD